MKRERPDLLSLCRQMFGADVVSISEDECAIRELAEVNAEGKIQLATGSVFLIRFSDRVVGIGVSEWGEISLSTAHQEGVGNE